MTNRRVLAIYGHPDDEGQVTGSLARFIAEGDEVTLVCATRGEVGEISDPSLGTAETLGYVRELELRASMAQVGFSDVRLLPYRDSGMDGTPENDDPRSLHQQDADTVVEAIVTIMRDVRPHMVFTWDPTGGYGHPDHVAVHKHTVSAFDVSGDASALPEAGPAWTPQRLYWGARTMKGFASIWMEMEKRGLLDEPIPDDRRERFEKAMAEPDPTYSVVADVSDFVAQKRAASGMHKSQFGENSMFARIPEELRARFFGEERFYQARPEWPADAEPTTEFPTFDEA